MDDLQAASEVDLEEASVLEGPQKDANEKPPAYDTLGVAQHVDQQQPDSGFVAEAPPTYQQLFGVKDSAPRRPHTRPRRRQTHQQQNAGQSLATQLQERHPKLCKLFLRLSVVCIISCLIALSSAMVIVGSLNFNRCVSMSVPLYLIVAGILILAELLFHGVIWFIMKHRENDSTLRALRMCDCVAFVLLIWLLIGSNWVFKLSIAGTSACDTPLLPIDDIIRLNTTVISNGSGGTQLIVVTETADTASVHTCMDCSSGVYQFTVIVILLQYIAALLILVGCCSKFFRK